MDEDDRSRATAERQEVDHGRRDTKEDRERPDPQGAGHAERPSRAHAHRTGPSRPVRLGHLVLSGHPRPRFVGPGRRVAPLYARGGPRGTDMEVPVLRGLSARTARRALRPRLTGTLLCRPSQAAAGRPDTAPESPMTAPRMSAEPRTIVEKIWDDHVVTQDPGAPAVLAVDLHLVHEVTSPAGLHRAARPRPQGPPTRPDRGHRGPLHPDHAALAADARRRWPPPRSTSSRPTAPSSASRSTASARRSQGIVHVIGPQLGPDPARDDDRLRRLAHEHARRVRGARVRDRDERGRDGPRDPDAAPARPEDLRGPRRRPPRPRRQRARTSSSR